MKLTDDEKLAASIAMLRGDSFSRGHALLFPHDGPTCFCVLQTIGPADKCKKTITRSWSEALAKFEEYTEASYEDYTTSSSNADYGPGNPWDAPGMSVRDFIKGCYD
jgi:hypothetical protein